MNMKTVQVGEFKANLSKYFKEIEKGESIAVSYGKKKDVIGVLVSPAIFSKINQRRIGILDGIATVEFMPDFKITDEEEFLGLK